MVEIIKKEIGLSFLDKLSENFRRAKSSNPKLRVFIIDGYRVSFFESGENFYTINRFDAGGQGDQAMRKIVRIAKITSTKVDFFISPVCNSELSRQKIIDWFEGNGFSAAKGENRKQAYIKNGDASLHMMFVG